MSQLHPVMEMALQPFAPRPIERQPQGAYHAGMSHYQHNIAGIILDCWLEYTEAQSSTDTDPAYPADADLCHVYHRGEDIFDLLPKWLREEIETAFLTSMGDA